jgi:hypothetical protein
MKYLKLFEEFVITKPKPKEIEKDELSGKNIDDVLKDDFLEDEDSDEVIKDEKGVYQIKNWTTY